MSRARLAAATAALLALSAVSALALPDLAPELYGVTFDPNQSVSTGDVAEGCAAATDGRLLLRFGVRFHNLGPDPLVIGDPGCPACALNPGAVCQDPRFICSPADGHNHPHLIGFADYQLLDFKGNSLREGGKKSFCVRDNRCTSGSPFFTCDNEGISPSCVDDYDPSLGCQYIDVTDVPDVTTRALRLRATLDPNAEFDDANRANNTTEVVIPGCGDGVVQPGEECDPGTTPADPCCGADCRLSPPPCVAPPQPCSSAGAAFTDGTPCGPGAPPCVVQVCRSGVCVPEVGGGGCLIGATCFPPGAVDPVDACQRCDPAQRTDSWSRNVDPNAAGLRCEVLRVTHAFTANGCRPGLVTRVEQRLMRVQQLVDQLGSASTAGTGRLNRRLSRGILRLVRVEHAGKRRGCDMGTFPEELATLVRQFATYRQSVGR
jgi:hypothetical protein